MTVRCSGRRVALSPIQSRARGSRIHAYTCCHTRDTHLPRLREGLRLSVAW